MERAEAEAILDGDRETALALLMRIDELIEANRRLESRVAELEQRLKRSSRNSSLPPSADPPSAPPRPRQAASGRWAGAQPGHPGRGRPLRPIEAIDELIDHWPERCACGHRFSETERCPVGKPARHRVAELPPTAVILSEHRLQRLRCPECGATARAALLAGVPPGAFGPRLQAAVATLAVRNRVSRRDTTELLRELFGARICAGSVEAILQRAALALDEPYEDLLGHVRAASALNIEKSGWRSAGKRRTLQGRAQRAGGAFAAPRVATAARPRRCSARTSPASPARTAGGPFDYLDPERRQLCSRPPGARLHRPQRGARRPEGLARAR